VRDQEKAKFNASFKNADLALAYLVQDLGKVGIRASPTDKNLKSIVQKAANIMDEIDKQVSAKPTPPPSAPVPPAATTPPAKKP
jgi:hypothetical protein